MRFVFKLPFRVEIFMMIRLRYLGLGHWKTILLNSSLGRVPQTLPNQYLGNASERPWSRPIVTAHESGGRPSPLRLLRPRPPNCNCEYGVPKMGSSIKNKVTCKPISPNILGDLNNLYCPGKWLHRAFGIAWGTGLFMTRAESD